MKLNFLRPAIVLVLSGIGLSSAGAVSLVPHRAVYDISLLTVDESASIGDVNGRMVFELTGSKCDGYAVNYRFVTRLGDKDGTAAVTDFRVATFEDADGSSFSFTSSNFINNNKVDEVQGFANRDDDKISVGLTKPEEEVLTFPGNAIFPTQQFEKLIAAAIDGQKIVQQVIFDGSEQGRKIFDATSLIGAKHSLADADQTGILSVAEVAKTPFWPVTVSYFDQGTGGEPLPNYVTSFDMHDNGISRNITMDYGDMILKAELEKLEVLEADPCN
uniref:cell envelope integrity EipB family protein n=1 Tax=Pararhizobium sp. IMCC3301 TaxID=3067904 RepID=UPI0027425390|nr:cell envelope integrity EipB family protein [Pararhizobium sp. IMCC3301]